MLKKNLLLQRVFEVHADQKKVHFISEKMFYVQSGIAGPSFRLQLVIAALKINFLSPPLPRSFSVVIVPVCARKNTTKIRFERISSPQNLKFILLIRTSWWTIVVPFL